MGKDVHDALDGYLTPYPVIMEWIARYAGASPDRITLRLDAFLDVLRLVIAGVPVDSDWYLAQSSGLERAIRSHEFLSARHHFVMHGFFEDRSPAHHQSTAATLPRYSDIRRMLDVTPVRGGLRVTIDKDRLHQIIAQIVPAIFVDEAWYLATNPAVADEVHAGTFNSGTAHFVSHGYYEGHMPFPMTVDETWYLAAFPDAAIAIDQGIVASATEHFVRTGYAEGRLPAAQWMR